MVLFTLLILILVLTIYICGENQKMDNFYKNKTDQIQLEYPKIEINFTKINLSTLVSDWSPGEEKNTYTQPFANNRLNSRIDYNLSDEVMKIQWQAHLPKYFEPSFVLDAREKIIVQGKTQWQLLDKSNGQQLLLLNKGDSDVVVDLASSSFFFINQSGYIATRRIECGELIHLCRVRLASNYKRLLIRYEKNAYYIVSQSYGPPPYGDGELWAVEKVGLGSSTEMDEDNILLNTQRMNMLVQKTGLLLMPVVDKSTTILSTDKRFYFLNEDILIEKAITGEFKPVVVSLDEKGNIYTIIKQEGNSLFWIVTQQGLVIMSVILPSNFEPVIPPIISNKHFIFIISIDKIIAISHDGTILWNQHAGGSIAGAIVTADDQLLVSVANFIAAFNSEGERRILYTFPEENLYTPPILTKHNKIFVASQNNLYCLKIEK